jgi:drug/metabolite transporter (DMT)-like permease
MFLGESISWKIGLAILLCYAGVALMYVSEKEFHSDANTALGVFLVIGAALSYSAYVILAKPIMKEVGSSLFTSLAMIGSSFFVGVHFACAGSPSHLVTLPPVVYVYTVLLAFVCTVLPSYMINAAILKIGATRTTVIGSVGPVLTMLLAVLLLGEPTTWKHFAGMLLAIGGVSLVVKK